ncbi:hypothetical protein ACFS5L_25450 [Streptomyces phyllanthi]|uniref:Uncharacterized protein n=1 Tax=Streptomyces phyllanthi TaxID=1803180 RepID=A0A5N8WEF4_9ACTN|nr:hypothetical protein [Streptomyces phyllanthi]MPY44828.1 hypothetical protein [Streptomyces phyllanthi]
MKSEDTPFVGGPLDGRVLPVLLGITGHPPKTYRVPVPDAAGGPPTVLVYRRVPRPHAGRFALGHKWRYEYDPEGGGDRGPRWPWSRPGAKPDAAPERKGDTTDE